jgi:hypothetical protein
VVVSVRLRQNNHHVRLRCPFRHHPQLRLYTKGLRKNRRRKQETWHVCSRQSRT